MGVCALRFEALALTALPPSPETRCPMRAPPANSRHAAATLHRPITTALPCFFFFRRLHRRLLPHQTPSETAAVPRQMRPHAAAGIPGAAPASGTGCAALQAACAAGVLCAGCSCVGCCSAACLRLFSSFANGCSAACGWDSVFLFCQLLGSFTYHNRRFSVPAYCCF